MSDIVTTSAPGKLMLFGEHAVVYGRPCIVTAVGQRLFVTVKKNGKDVLDLSVPDLGLHAYSKSIKDLGGEGLPKSVQFLEIFYRNFLRDYPQDRGLSVVTKSEFSASYGLGSSSAVVVAFAQALSDLYDLGWSKEEIFERSYQAVLDVQGVGSGFDVAAGVWGGTIYYVRPGKMVRAVQNGLRFVVGYTGVKADTPTLVRRVAEMKRKDKKGVESIFEKIKEIVNEAEEAIGERKLELVGKLMNENQELLRRLEVSSVELERLIGAALEAGAYGAKLSGAGGGDCMLAVIDEESEVRVRKAIEEAGGEVVEAGLNADGVRREK